MLYPVVIPTRERSETGGICPLIAEAASQREFFAGKGHDFSVLPQLKKASDPQEGETSSMPKA
jgi:hypothetical protein